MYPFDYFAPSRSPHGYKGKLHWDPPRARPAPRKLRGHHARKAEKLITLMAIPAYDPINIVKIILIINYPIDVWVIKARFLTWAGHETPSRTCIGERNV